MPDLWRLLGIEAEREAARKHHKALCTHFSSTSGDEQLHCHAPVSGIVHDFRFSPQLLLDLYLPLTVHLRALGVKAKEKGQGCVLVGLAAPAGAGKSSLVAILQCVASAYERELQGTTDEGDTTSTESFMVAVSMDAYHRFNADLIERDLKRFKGRIDTINAGAFADDLAVAKAATQLVAAADGGAAFLSQHSRGMAQLENGAVWMPEYDRAVTHDPVPRAIEIKPCHTVVLVEGLFMCRGGSNEADGIAVDPAWNTVRSLLDVAIFLDVPLQTCRRRAVLRKARNAKPPLSIAASEEHYDRVDLKTWWALQADKAKPVPFGPDLVLGIDGDAADEAESGATASPLAVCDTCRFVSATVRAAPQTIAEAIPTQAATPAPHLVVLGLNPCVQRTLIFSSGAGLTRGVVNRASSNKVAVGGKGQHTVIAAAREAGFIASSTTAATDDDAASSTRLRLSHVAFLGGSSGEEVRRMLRDALPFPRASVALDDVSVDTTSAGSFTRTCTTLIDKVKGDMTELVEAPGKVSDAMVRQLLESVQAIIAPTRAESATAPDAPAVAAVTPAPVIAMMGTVPPGADDIYRQVAARAAAAKDQPVVLLDGHKNVLPVLRTGGVTLLKINVDELEILVHELEAAGHAFGDAVPLRESFISFAAVNSRTEAVVRNCAKVFLAFRVRFIALTDGPGDAYFVERLSSMQQEDDQLAGMRVHTYTLPPALPSPLENAIGAGDTVAAVTLVRWMLCGRGSWVSAFAHGLAAGSASCCTLTGADWSAEHAEAVLRGIRVSTTEQRWA
jgi:pantothenate kinase/fructose-1-phosphate kinase PfkB-like protein